MDWKSIVGAVAPVLGTALGGPLGGLAVKAIGDALGVSAATEESVSAAIAGAKPEDLLKLKQADQQFAKDMRALEIDVAKIGAANTADARQMQVQTRSWVPSALAVMVTVGFFGILAGMLIGTFKTSENQALLIMLGALGAAWGAIVNFYFGSSSGSQQKDATIQAAVVK